jgi:hypothetical protein
MRKTPTHKPGRLLATGVTALAAVSLPVLSGLSPTAAAAPDHTSTGSGRVAAASCPADQHYGQSGSCVTSLQKKLHAYYSWLDVDGKFGPQTLEAVLAYQSTRGLSVDGDAGPKTKAALAAKKPAKHQIDRTTMAALRALQNRNGSACHTNTEGGKGFNSSCTGNGGQPEYWCADYVGWVWGHSGNSETGVTAWAPTVYEYGQKHGTLHTSSSYVPRPGDAITYSDSSAVQHVGIVAAMNGPENQAVIISGDTHGTGDTQAEYASTSKVWIDVAAAGSWKVGQSPDYTRHTISSYVSPVAS